MIVAAQPHDSRHRMIADPECIRRPHPADSDPVRAHYDRHGFYFAESNAAREIFARRSRLGTLLRADDFGDGPIIDVGCGEARAHALLSPRQRRRHIGVDISMGILSRARRRFPEAQFLEGTATDLPFTGGFAALTISQGVLHHTEDPRRAFAGTPRSVSRLVILTKME